MSTVIFYLVCSLSLTAIFIKFWLLVVARGSIFTENKLIGLLLLFLVGGNCTELLSFFNADVLHNQVVLNGLKIYYVFLICAGCCLLRLSRIYVGIRFSPKMDTALVVMVLILLLPFASDAYLSGYSSIGYTLTRVAGDYYAVVQVLLIGSYVLPSLAFAYGAWIKKSAHCKTLFLGSLGMVIVLVSTVVLMMFGFQASVAGFFPFATTVFVMSIIYTECRWHLFGLLSQVPGTQEHKVKLALSQQMPLKDAEDLVVKLIIDRELFRTGNNISETARNLGTSRPTLYRRYPGLKDIKKLSVK